MKKITRRTFLKSGSALSLLGLTPAFNVLAATGGSTGRVVVIGGGYGGAIAAKYIKKLDPKIDVTLIEKNQNYVSCPLSNELLGGERDIESLTFNYSGMSNRGIKVVHDVVDEIDAVKQAVRTSGGNTFNYDKLVVSPGIDFQWDKIEGYDAEIADTKVPHAWKAGPQTVLLRKQLVAMKDGGTVIIAAPPNPFRCPPGPYERAAQIAHYLHTNKPKSKILLLDAKDKFSKQGLFKQGWSRFYGDMIEWVGAAGGGSIEGLDLANSSLIGEVEEFKGDVLNIIPPQKAAPLAFKAGLTDTSGWCPVNQKTFESTIHKNIHVIGDSCIAGKMPKSGYAANSQGKVCAAAIVAELSNAEIPEPSYVNTCYSIVSPEYGFSVAAVYQLHGGSIVPVKGAGGLSPMDAPDVHRMREAQFARGWFKNITSDMFG